ncbi:hypothetical protein V6N13_012535 [Hibiscus sabdariffa]
MAQSKTEFSRQHKARIPQEKLKLTVLGNSTDKENIRSPNNQANPSSKLSTPSDSPFVLGLWVCIVTIEATPSES